MRILAAARTHAVLTRRNKPLMASTVALTLLTVLLIATSRQNPTPQGAAGLASISQSISMVNGVAYAAGQSSYFVAYHHGRIRELEASTPASQLTLDGARMLGTVSMSLVPSAAFLLVVAALQTLKDPWSIPAALAAIVTIVAPSALVATSLSALLGATLPSVLARLVAVTAWITLLISTPLIPLPTPNGTLFNLVGDAVVSGYFGCAPIYRPTAGLAYDGTPATASLSLFFELLLAAVLFVSGSRLAARRSRV